jgi:hypothetical protein
MISLLAAVSGKQLPKASLSDSRKMGVVCTLRVIAKYQSIIITIEDYGVDHRGDNNYNCMNLTTQITSPMA